MKRIELILMDDAATGPKKYTIGSETTIGYHLHRAAIGKTMDGVFFDSLKTPGVYVLIGKHAKDKKDSIYIGQSDNVAHRLYEHKGGQEGEKQRGKLFWEECMAFVATGDQLQKGHAEYLELAFYLRAYAANRYVLENENQPGEKRISEGDLIFCDDFLEDCDLLSSLMGRPIFQPLADGDAGLLGQSDKLFICNGDRRGLADPRYVNASGYVCQSDEYDQGFLVLENSIIARETTKKASPAIKRLRRELTKRGYLREEDGVLTFKKEYLFPSAGIAAAVILGRNASAKDWKNGKP